MLGQCGPREGRSLTVEQTVEAKRHIVSNEGTMTTKAAASKAAASRAAILPARNSGADFPPDQSVGYLVREAHRAFLRALSARVSRHGVSIGMWYFLRALWEEDGLTQRELSRRVKMMEPTTATALESMERCGLISRTRNSRGSAQDHYPPDPERPALARSTAAMRDGSEPGSIGRNTGEADFAFARATRPNRAQPGCRCDPGRWACPS